MKTNCKADIFASPEELGCLSDAELELLTEDTTDFLRSKLHDAAAILNISKLKTGDLTPWRVLLDTYRAGSPMQAEIEIIDQDGVPRKQLVLRERGYGLIGRDQLMFSAIQGLSDALNDIERLRSQPGSYVNAVVKSHVMSNWPRGKPTPRFKPDQIGVYIDKAIARNSRGGLLKLSLSRVIDRVIYEWEHPETGAGPGKPPPGKGTIRPIVEARFPDHPAVQKKVFKKTAI